MKTIKLKRNEKLSIKDAKTLFNDITKHEQRLEIETRGPWSIISHCRGLAMTRYFDTGDVEIFGYRTLSNPRSSGYQLEGWASISGEKRSAFTESHLFTLENNHMIDVGIIFIRNRKR